MTALARSRIEVCIGCADAEGLALLWARGLDYEMQADEVCPAARRSGSRR